MYAALCKPFLWADPVFVCQEVNTIVGQSTSFQKQALIRHCKQEGLQPSLVALFKTASSPAQKVLLLCIDFSPTGGRVKVGDLDGTLGIWGFTEVAVLRMNYS